MQMYFLYKLILFSFLNRENDFISLYGSMMRAIYLSALAIDIITTQWMLK